MKAGSYSQNCLDYFSIVYFIRIHTIISVLYFEECAGLHNLNAWLDWWSWHFVMKLDCKFNFYIEITIFREDYEFTAYNNAGLANDLQQSF